MLILILELLVVCILSLPAGLFVAQLLGCDSLVGKVIAFTLPFIYFPLRFSYSRLLRDEPSDHRGS